MPITTEQLLATLSLDAASVSVSTSGRYVLIQRDPQPDEGGIAIDTDVVFMIVDLDGDPAGPTTLTPEFDFYLDSNHVFSFIGGIALWSSPWTGSVVTHTSSSPYTFWKFTSVQPATPLFISEQIVPAQLDLLAALGWGHAPWGHFPWGHIPGAIPAQSFLYEFQIEDLTPPRLVSVEVIDQLTIRATFNESMAVTGAGSVLGLPSWVSAIQRFNVDPLPGVNLEVISVSEVADSGGIDFDIVFNWEMTQGCPYQVTIPSTAADISGNPIDPEYSSADFNGYTLPLVKGRFFNHWRMMIPFKNRIEDATRDLERFSNCISESLGLLLNEVDKFTDEFDLDLCSDETILAMLYDMGNPFEVDDLTPNDRRKLLQFLVEIYRLKGTDPGIEGTIWFLLGEDVDVVPYSAEGWVLGEDELGEGSIAEILCDAGETYDFSVAKTLLLKVDGYVDPVTLVPLVQSIVFQPADFADPNNGLASEVVAVVMAQIQQGGAYVVAAGTPASYTSPVAPFNLSGGETVTGELNGTSFSFTFHASDFATAGAGTADEVGARIEDELGESLIVGVDGASFVLNTKHTGADAQIKFVGGTALAGLGITPGTEALGTDAKRVQLYSSTSGVGSWIEVTGGNANDILEFDTDVYSGTGGAILAPEDSYTLYCFDIETQTELDSEVQEQIRVIVNYMKVAHEHLVNIRVAPPLPWPDGWVLGVSELGVSTELAL